MSFWLCCLSLVIQLYFPFSFPFLFHPQCCFFYLFVFYFIYSFLLFTSPHLSLSRCVVLTSSVSLHLSSSSQSCLCVLSPLPVSTFFSVLFPVSLVFVPVPVLCLGLSLSLRTTSCLMCIVWSLKRKSIGIFKTPKEIKSSSSLDQYDLDDSESKQTCVFSFASPVSLCLICSCRVPMCFLS